MGMEVEADLTVVGNEGAGLPLGRSGAYRNCWAGRCWVSGHLNSELGVFCGRKAH